MPNNLPPLTDEERQRIIAEWEAPGASTTLRQLAAELRCSIDARYVNALFDKIASLEDELQRWRKGMPKRQHVCPSCGLSDAEEAYADGWNACVEAMERAAKE